MSATEGGFDFAALPNDWLVGRFAALAELDAVEHVVTTRRGPDVAAVAAVAADTANAAGPISEALGAEGLAWCDQVHGVEVLTADRPGLAGRGDVLVTDRAAVAVTGRSADCPLILAADPVAGAVGMAHASWRGTVRRIASVLIAALADRYGSQPTNVVACICPSAGPCCYEVGEDVRAAAEEGLGSRAGQYFLRREESMHLDLWSANVAELRLAGVPASSIHVAGVCTICRNDLFPSYRVEGQSAGRFLGVIALT